MPGATTITITNKITFNKFDRAEFMRQNKERLDYFDQVKLINKENKLQLVADYLDVMIAKSLNIADSFFDDFVTIPRIPQENCFSTKSKSSFLNLIYAAIFSAANFLFYFLIQATIFIVKFIQKIIKFIKNFAKLLFLKLKYKFNIKIPTAFLHIFIVRSSRFSVLRNKLLNSETTNKNLAKLKDCARYFL